MPNSERLKARMRELGVTQQDLADTLNLAAPTICQKINGIRPLFLSEAEAIAARLNIPDTEFRQYFFKDKLA